MTYIISLDNQGKEVDRKVKTRGRPPKGFYRHSDGNFYNRSPLKPVETEKPQEVKVNEEDSQIENVRPKKRIVAHKRTTLKKLLGACCPYRSFVIDDEIHLISPIFVKETGLVILDSFGGQPIFHEIIIDTLCSTVTVFGLKNFQQPLFLIEEALLPNGDDSGIKTQIKCYSGS